MHETFLDQFDPSGNRKLSTLKITKKSTVYMRQSDGSMEQKVKDIKIAYEVPCVTPGIRFLYYLVDLFFILSGVSALIAYMFTQITSGTPALAYLLFLPFGRVILIIMVIVPYYMLEAFTGKSIAKMLFGYSVINESAEKPTIKEVLIRSICRIVPFEAFSCFGNPSRGWHDKWSGTYVVADGDLPKIRELLSRE